MQNNISRLQRRKGRMIKRIEDVHPEPYHMVRMKKAGSIIEVKYLQNRLGSPIEKISKDEYVLKSTGEIRAFKHTEHRTDNKASLAASMQRLRDLLSTNVTNNKNALWCTLTYKTPPTEKQVYEDFRRFNQRLKNYIKREFDLTYSYIVVWEPTAKGVLHAHLVLIFPRRRPFINSEKLAYLWGCGFVSVKALRDADNVANYLCAYLTDLSLEEAIPLGVTNIWDKGKAIEVTDEQGNKSKNFFVKGARLFYYKPGFRLFRTSRDIKKPEVTECKAADAMREIGDAPCIFKRTVAVYASENSDTPVNIINVQKYDMKKGTGDNVKTNLSADGT